MDGQITVEERARLIKMYLSARGLGEVYTCLGAKIDSKCSDLVARDHVGCLGCVALKEALEVVPGELVGRGEIKRI